MTADKAATQTGHRQWSSLAACFGLGSRYHLNMTVWRHLVSAVSAVCSIAVLLHNSPAAAQSFSYDGAVRFSKGTYTLSETVTSVFFLNEFSFTSRRWWAEAVLSVIYQDSPNVRYVGGMPMPDGGHHDGGGGGGHHGGGGMPGGHDPPYRDFDKLGLADPYFSVGAIVFRDVFDRNSIATFASVKVPVADETQGFGSGEWDFGAGVSWYRRTPRDLFFAELAFWSLGDPPDVDLKNPIALELSYGRALDDGRYLVEASLWGRTETIEGIDGPIAIDLTLSRALKSQHSVYVTAEAGLTESAPDYSVSVGYRTRIWKR